MDNDIMDSLNDLGYTGPLTDETAFAKALEGGPKSLEFTKLIHILADELKTLCNLEETVNMMNDPDESSSFLLELSSFLKELGCPYKKLVTGHMSSRLETKEDRMLLLDYLISELMAARIVNVDRPKEKPGMEIVMPSDPEKLKRHAMAANPGKTQTRHLEGLEMCQSSSFLSGAGFSSSKNNIQDIDISKDLSPEEQQTLLLLFLSLLRMFMSSCISDQAGPSNIDQDNFDISKGLNILLTMLLEPIGTVKLKKPLNFLQSISTVSLVQGRWAGIFGSKSVKKKAMKKVEKAALEKNNEPMEKRNKSANNLDQEAVPNVSSSTLLAEQKALELISQSFFILDEPQTSSYNYEDVIPDVSTDLSLRGLREKNGRQIVTSSELGMPLSSSTTDVSRLQNLGTLIQPEETLNCNVSGPVGLPTGNYGLVIPDVSKTLSLDEQGKLNPVPFSLGLAQNANLYQATFDRNEQVTSHISGGLSFEEQERLLLMSSVLEIPQHPSVLDKAELSNKNSGESLSQYDIKEERKKKRKYLKAKKKEARAIKVACAQTVLLGSVSSTANLGLSESNINSGLVTTDTSGLLIKEKQKPLPITQSGLGMCQIFGQGIPDRSIELPIDEQERLQVATSNTLRRNTQCPPIYEISKKKKRKMSKARKQRKQERYCSRKSGPRGLQRRLREVTKQLKKSVNNETESKPLIPSIDVYREDGIPLDKEKPLIPSIDVYREDGIPVDKAKPLIPSIDVYREDGIPVDKAFATLVRGKLSQLIEGIVLRIVNGEPVTAPTFAACKLHAEGRFLVTPATIESGEWLLSQEFGEIDGHKISLRPMTDSWEIVWETNILIWVPGKPGTEFIKECLSVQNQELEGALRFKDWRLIRTATLELATLLTFVVPNSVEESWGSHLSRQLFFLANKVKAKIVRRNTTHLGPKK